MLGEEEGSSPMDSGTPLEPGSVPVTEVTRKTNESSVGESFRLFFHFLKIISDYYVLLGHTMITFLPM
jgi:hypothetical protein